LVRKRKVAQHTYHQSTTTKSVNEIQKAKLLIDKAQMMWRGYDDSALIKHRI
jgi:hypothetical protein